MLRAVVLTAANRFELASTRSLAEGCLSINDCYPLIFTLVPVSEVSRTTIESTTEKIIKLCAIETPSLISKSARSLWERYTVFLTWSG